MNSNLRCPDCGSPLAEPGILCPHCLYARAAPTDADVARVRQERWRLLRCLAARATPTPTDADAAPTVASVTASAPASRGSSLGRLQYFGDYELLEEIARGGMGVVYKARQTSLNRLVAVKMILSGQLAGPAEVKRFRAEAEAAANLQHPNIVAIHEVGEHAGQHYFSMDLVEGRNLADLAKAERIAPARAAQLVSRVADAVHHAHQHGIIHRDLKPQNVLVDRSDVPRVTDFGLAKRLDADDGVTRSGAVVGTPSYMPPEQASGRLNDLRPSSDVYSIGAILYHLLTGHPPCLGATQYETIQRVLNEEPVRPSKLNPAVPRDLEVICLKCLEKLPSRRYPSAAALAEDLQRFLDGQPILASPSPLGRRIVRGVQRRPWILPVLLSILALGLFWSAYYLYAENRQLRSGTNPTEPDRNLTEFLWIINYFVGALGFFRAFPVSIFDRLRRRRVLTGQPVGGLALAAFGALAAASIAYSVFVGTRVIDNYRWRNHPATIEDIARQQAERSKLGLEPERSKPAPPQSAKVLLFLLSVVVLIGGASALILRQVVDEAVFVMYPNPHEEERARNTAASEEAEEIRLMPPVTQAQLRWVLWLAASGTAVALGTLLAEHRLREDPFPFSLIPAATALGLLTGAAATWAIAPPVPRTRLRALLVAGTSAATLAALGLWLADLRGDIAGFGALGLALGWGIVVHFRFSQGSPTLDRNRS